MAKKRKKKKKKAKKKKVPSMGLIRRSRWASDEELDRAYELLDQGKLEEATQEAENLLSAYPDDPYVHVLAGNCYSLRGHRSAAAWHFMKAHRMEPSDLEILEAATRALAVAGYLFLSQKHWEEWRLRTHRESMPELAERIYESCDDIRGEFMKTYQTRPRIAEEVMNLHDEVRLHLEIGDYQRAIQLGQKILKRTPQFVPVRNNMAMAYFLSGKVELALQIAEETRQKLEAKNLHNLSNLVIFYSLLDQKEKAMEYLEEALGIFWESPKADALEKLTQACRYPEDDQLVYDFLQRAAKEFKELPDMGWLALGSAAANLGKEKEAFSYWKKVKSDPWMKSAQFFAEELRRAKPGPGYASRYPLVIDWEVLQVFLSSKEIEKVLSGKSGFSLKEFSQRHPGFRKYLIRYLWEAPENESREEILRVLALSGDPVVQAEVKKFCLGKQGRFDDRIAGLLALLEAGVYRHGQRVRVWHEGGWREIELKGWEITEELPREFPEEARQKLEEGTKALWAWDFSRAEKLLREALEIAPDMAPAYNNLATLYSMKGESKKAEEYLKKAIEVDPSYVHGRCNLARMFLHRGDLESALKLLAPLTDHKKFHVQDASDYWGIQAEVQMAMGRLEEAYKASVTALRFNPSNQSARSLYRTLDFFMRVRSLAQKIPTKT